MKFYKCHSQKYKNNKVLFVPEQFDEIGPDVFRSASFEIIILSRKVKTISDHAFTDLKNCKVYIPDNVTEIDPLAFEDIYEGNEFFCNAGSVAYKVLSENGQIINEDIPSILKLAEILSEEDKKNKPVSPPKVKVDEAKTLPADEPLNPQCDNPSVPVEETPEPSNETNNEEEFIELFGFPPVVDEITGMAEEWKKDISRMDNEEILFVYDDQEYTSEFRLLCYRELKSRYLNKEISYEDIKASENKDLESEDEPEIIYYEEIEIVSLIGVPPQCREEEIEPEWYESLEMLSTAEILERYDSDDWTEAYKLACYKVLSQRKDLKTVINN